jgi:hypothetical protein
LLLHMTLPQVQRFPKDCILHHKWMLSLSVSHICNLHMLLTFQMICLHRVSTQAACRQICCSLCECHGVPMGSVKPYTRRRWCRLARVVAAEFQSSLSLQSQCKHEAKLCFSFVRGHASPAHMCTPVREAFTCHALVQSSLLGWTHSRLLENCHHNALHDLYQGRLLIFGLQHSEYSRFGAIFCCTSHSDSS